MDKWGYPEQTELERIEKWRPDDLHGLMSYIHDLWHLTDWGWKQCGEVYYISTGDWSGNEKIIDTMIRKIVWWALYHDSSRRGGHYVFSPPGQRWPNARISGNGIDKCLVATG